MDAKKLKKVAKKALKPRGGQYECVVCGGTFQVKVYYGQLMSELGDTMLPLTLVTIGKVSKPLCPKCASIILATMASIRNGKDSKEGE